MMISFTVLTWVAMIALVFAEFYDSSRGRWIAKPLASLGFVALAVAAGAPSSLYGQVMLVGFVLCWIGDVLLIPKKEITFLAGLGTFLLGHVAFAAAFWIRGTQLSWAGGTFVALLLVGGGILRWLLPHVAKPMRPPVIAYVVVITSMVSLAAGCASLGFVLPLMGAIAFYVSDLAVARDQFVAPGFVNRLWGLPLYYAAQLIFAWSL